VRGVPHRRARHSHPAAPPAPPEPPIDRRPELLPDDRRRARLGTIELIAAVIVVAALVALAVWFFAFAHNPLLRP